MEFIISLLRKVPAAFRFFVLIAVAVVGFVMAMNGISGDTRLWQAFVGVPIFILVVFTFYYLIKNKTEL